MPQAADAVEAVDAAWLRARFTALGETDYDGPGDEDDFDYTWDTLVELRRFLRTAAENESRSCSPPAQSAPLGRA